MHSFFLSPEIITRGHLTGDDYSAYAGFRVSVFKLDVFRHWGKVDRKLPLTPDEKAERAEDMRAVLRNSDHIAGNHNKIDLSDITHHSPFIRRVWNRVVVHTPFDAHLKLIRQQGPGIAIDAVNAAYQDIVAYAFRSEMRRGIFPGLLNEQIPVEELFRAQAAYVCVRPEDNPRRDWSNFTGLAANKINLPSGNWLRLYSDMHEMRHIPQIFNNNDDMLSYYTELDAELFPRSHFRRAGIGAETLQAALHGRYLQTLFCLNRLWIAPALEAIESGKELPNFFEVCLAVHEVRARLAIDILGHKQNPSKHDILSDAIASFEGYPLGPTYAHRQTTGIIPIKRTTKERYALYLKNVYHNVWTTDTAWVEHCLPRLHRLLETNTFTNPLARHIAARIIEAGEYFIPGAAYTANFPQAHPRAATLIQAVV